MVPWLRSPRGINKCHRGGRRPRRKEGEIHVDSTDPPKLRPLFPFLAPKMAIWIKTASAPPRGDLGKDRGGGAGGAAFAPDGRGGIRERRAHAALMSREQLILARAWKATGGPHSCGGVGATTGVGLYTTPGPRRRAAAAACWHRLGPEQMLEV